VINTVGPRHPFLVSDRSRRAVLGRILVEWLVTLLVVGLLASVAVAATGQVPVVP